MNERIKELVSQAGFSEDFINDYPLGVYQQKFAELIVNDCLCILENSRIQGDEGVCLVGATKIKIKQHFGVE